MSRIVDVSRASSARWLELSREDPRAGYFQSIAWARSTRSLATIRGVPLAIQVRFEDATISVLPLPASDRTPWCDPIASRPLDAEETEAVRRRAPIEIPSPSPYGSLADQAPRRAQIIDRETAAGEDTEAVPVDAYGYWQAAGAPSHDFLSRLERLRDPGIGFHVRRHSDAVVGGLVTVRWNRIASEVHRFGEPPVASVLGGLLESGARLWDGSPRASEKS